MSKRSDVNSKNSSGHSALMYAAEFNPNPEVITTLLKAGVDLNAQEVNGALMYVAGENPNPKVVTTLLRAGADLNTKHHYGWTPLMYLSSCIKMAFDGGW